jgi:hypothetical protein
MVSWQPWFYPRLVAYGYFWPVYVNCPLEPHRHEGDASEGSITLISLWVFAPVAPE